MRRRQACHRGFSCDLLATDAQRRRGDGGHTAIVLASGPDTFETIEDNTNDAGDQEGYEVCRRVRGYKSLAGTRLT